MTTGNQVNCDWVEERVDAYLDDELGAKELQLFTAHASACTSCERELAIATAVANELRSLPTLSAPDYLVTRAIAHADTRARGGLLGWLRPALGTLAIALVAAAAFWSAERTAPPANNVASPMPAEVEAARHDLMLAFGVVGKYSRSTAIYVGRSAMRGQVAPPVRDAVKKTREKTQRAFDRSET